MSVAEDFPKPKFITGGCLCGAVRYRVDFPPTHNFVESSGTCQCTQCRRQTSSLVAHCHRIAPASTALTLTGPGPAPAEYRSSPGAVRGFCAGCGSLIYWKVDGPGDSVSLAVGTVDPLFLWGEGAPGGSPEAGGDEHGVPAGGFARALLAPGLHLWCANEIPGFTDPASMAALARGRRVMGDGEW